MISLCSKTLELAEKKKNFSEWVRSKLLQEAEVETVKIRWRYECDECEKAWITKHHDNFFYCPECYMPSTTLKPIQEVIE
jgi:Zn finger protein HypA/HybF involved in hydrogenase expression